VIPANSQPSEDRVHVLTVNAEEYFHGRGLARAVPAKHWDRLESRLERNIDDVLAMLRFHAARATFFLFGWSVEKHPEVVGRILREGHEVASRGFWPGPLGPATPDEFRESLARTKTALLAAGASEVVGFRAPRWIDPSDAWILDVLIDEGYGYDASINPLFRRFAGTPEHYTVHRRIHSRRHGWIWEVPVSTVELLGLRMAVSGGNYLRQLPHWLVRRGLEYLDRSGAGPIALYFTSWEIDDEQPQIVSASSLERIRQYRNASDARAFIEECLDRYRFVPVARYLGLESVVPAADPATVREATRVVGSSKSRAGAEPNESLRAGAERAVDATSSVSAPVPVSIVVPLYNEEQGVTYLKRTLDGLIDALADRYLVELILVDDGSGDATARAVEKAFAGCERTTLVRHAVNRGVAAAILTGIAAASSEIVCSIDCDCSYDPHELARMIPMLEGADLVTASPYHRRGRVLHVPGWRLFLSKTLSRLYRVLLGSRIATYTSCFRVYRRSVMTELEIDNGGFLGVAETLIRLYRRGAVIREYPATLESRLLGVSKMKTVPVVIGHLRLLGRVAAQRLTAARRPRDTRRRPTRTATASSR